MIVLAPFIPILAPSYIIVLALLYVVKGLEGGLEKVDIRLPGNRNFKLPWHKAVLLQSSR